MSEDLRRFAQDFADRQAARLALPSWLRAVMPVTFLSCSFGSSILLFMLLSWFRNRIRPELGSLIPAAKGPAQFEFLAFLLCVFVSGVCASLILANVLLWLVPPIRRVLDENARGIPGHSFSAVMNQGRKAILYVGLPCTATAALLAWAPWV